MAYRWPILDVYEVPDSEALINKCLETLRGLTLIEQLKARGIVSLCARPLLIEGCLASSDTGGLVLCFDSETGDTTSRCITIAHELGHTFELKPKTLDLFVEKKSNEYVVASENFAEAFAHQWLRDEKTVAELRLFLEHHFATSPEKHIRIDLKSLEYS